MGWSNLKIRGKIARWTRMVGVSPHEWRRRSCLRAERLNVHMIAAIVLRIEREKESTIASARQVAMYPQT